MGWIALSATYLHTKFGDSSSKGVGARGQKAEMQKCALRAHFCTLGAVRPHGTQVRPRPFWPEGLGSRPPPVWAVAVLEIFSNFSRGGTWRVTRDTWRHVTKTIVVPDLWLISWCRSRPDRLRRSGVIDGNAWTHRTTNTQTAGRHFISLTLPGPVEISIHQNGLRPFFFISILN